MNWEKHGAPMSSDVVRLNCTKIFIGSFEAFIILWFVVIVVGDEPQRIQNMGMENGGD